MLWFFEPTGSGTGTQDMGLSKISAKKDLQSSSLWLILEIEGKAKYFPATEENTMTARKNSALLTELGFKADGKRPDVLVLDSPKYPELKLVAFDNGRIDAVDLFTELGSQPMNYLNDSRNICIRVQNHNDVFAESVIRTVVDQFRNVSS